MPQAIDGSTKETSVLTLFLRMVGETIADLFQQTRNEQVFAIHIDGIIFTKFQTAGADASGFSAVVGGSTWR